MKQDYDYVVVWSGIVNGLAVHNRTKGGQN